MGMTIEEARTALGKERKYALHENKQAFDIAIDTMRKYQQLQAEYETRLKADMVAMLTELQLEFEEDLECGACCDNCHESCEDIPARWFLDFIQEKIKALKED